MSKVIYNRKEQPRRGSDILTRGEVPYTQALNFVRACKLLTDVIEKGEPDVVFFPQRGAGPIRWVTEVLLEDTNIERPVFVDLPIGTHIEINHDELPAGGITGGAKDAIIDEQLAQLSGAGLYIPGETKLMLVDEVQKGGTISKAAGSIRKSMTKRGDEKNNLQVVAFQDTRSSLIGQARKPIFGKMATNQIKGIESTVIPTKLFMVDRDALLDDIFRLSDADSPVHLDDFIIHENIGARRLFASLGRVYLQPLIALHEIDELKRQALRDDIDATLIQREICENLTDPVPVIGGKAVKADTILEWWSLYAQKIISSRRR